MVIGLLTITAIPTTIGVAEAISAQKKQNQAEKEKARFGVTVQLAMDDESPTVECPVVLGGGKLYIDHPQLQVPAHKFSGYYFTYPSEEQYLGLVSTIADDPPMLNWIYVLRDSGEVRHAGRKDTLEQLIGPWGWSDDEKWLTLEGQTTGFIAVEHPGNKAWSLYLDRDRCDSNSNWGRPVIADQDGIPLRWAPVRLQRKMVLGMESKWVRDSEKDKAQQPQEKKNQ